MSALRAAFSFCNLINKACFPGQLCEPSLKSSMHEAYAFYMHEALKNFYMHKALGFLYAGGR